MLNLVHLVLIFLPLFTANKQDTSQKPFHRTIQVKQHLKPLPGPPPAIPEEFEKCVFTTKFTSAQRLRRYPYSKAVRIVVVSYPAAESAPEPEVIIDDSNNPKTTQTANVTSYEDDSKYFGLHVNKGVLDSCSINESIILNSQQINRLTYLIYNTSHRPLPKRFGGLEIASPVGSCFFPRQAILFYDNHGRIFDYMEICFECQRYSSKWDRLTLGDYCTNKYDLLKSFFKKIGLTYHLNDNDHD